MNNEQRHYELKKKLTWELITLLLIAMIGLGATFLIFSNRFGNIVLWILEKIFMLDYYVAIAFYQDYIRSYQIFIFLIVFILFIISLYRYSLKNIMFYFDEIEGGIDKLSLEKESHITLSPELGFMEEKLNHVQATLDAQKLALQENEKRKNELIMYLAHDLRTPLTTIVGYMKLMEENPTLSLEKRAEYTGLVLEKANRLELLLDELFELTQIGRENITINKHSINLSLMLEQIADEFYPDVKKDNRSIHLELSNDMQAEVDPDLISRVFRNLIKNAINYSDKQKDIFLIGNVNQNNLIINVRSFGETIPKEQQEKLFEQFYRRDDARKTSTGGSGLGLPIAKNFIELHGGKITLTSERGQTDFIITLPK